MPPTEPLNICILQSYLEKYSAGRFSFPFQPCNNDQLILREFRGYYKDSEERFHPVLIILTVDGFVHLFA